ncbi:MAG: hypothetical protein GC186_10970 [Rhodobacteraceae bacterium]|nr:hypothetical protein [Paracoccaceae bacterium]
MDASSREEFEDRLRRIEEARVRAALTRAPVALGADLPRPWQRAEIGLKLAGMAAAAVIVLKGALMLDIGVDAYDQHRAMLAQGSILDQFAAMLMRPDPVTMLLRATAGGAVTSVASAQTKIDSVVNTAATAPSETPTSAPTSLNFNPVPTAISIASAPAAQGIGMTPKPRIGPTTGGAIRGGINFVHAPAQGGPLAGANGSGSVRRGKAGMFVTAPLPHAPGASP